MVAKIDSTIADLNQCYGDIELKFNSGVIDGFDQTSSPYTCERLTTCFMVLENTFLTTESTPHRFSKSPGAKTNSISYTRRPCQSEDLNLTDMLLKKHVFNKPHFLPYAEGYWCNEPGEPHEASNVFFWACLVIPISYLVSIYISIILFN